MCACLIGALIALAGTPIASSTLAQASAQTEDISRFADAVERSQLRERALDVLAQAAFDTNPGIRANALEGLESTPSRLEPIARAALSDQNLGVRFAAAMMVGRTPLPKSAPFVRPLLSDPDERVRLAAIYALASNGQPVDQNPLARALKHADPRVRSQAAFILGEIGNESAAPMLREAAKSRETGSPSLERLFRLQLAEALVKLGDRQAIDSLRAALYPSTREEFESAVLAAQAIGELRDEGSAAQLVNLVEQLAPGAEQDATRDPAQRRYLQPKELRLAATIALAKMGYADGVYVADMYAGDPVPAVRAQTTFLYAEIGTLESLAKLEGMLDDASPLVRVSASASAVRLVDTIGARLTRARR